MASGVFSSAAVKHFGSVVGHEHIVLDANADVPELLGYARRGANIDARLDGERHAGLEHSPFPAHLVVADVVHIETQPVAGAMVEKRQVGLLLDQLRDRALEQSELDQPLGDRAHRGFVRLVPMISGPHFVDGGRFEPRARLHRPHAAPP